MPGYRSASDIAITANGRHALVLQGGTDGSGLVRVRLTKAPPRVTGVNRNFDIDVNSHIAIRGRYAYIAQQEEVVVARIDRKRPRIVRVVHFPYDVGEVAVAGKRPWLYVAERVGYQGRLRILRIGKRGKLRKAGRTRLVDYDGFGVAPGGNRLLLDVNGRVRVYSLRHPRKPKKVGRNVALIRHGEAKFAFTRNGRFAYVLVGGASASGVVKVNVNRRRAVRRRTVRVGPGDIALARRGRRILVVDSTASPSEGSNYLLNPRLRTTRKLRRPMCYPSAVAVSLRGRTKDRFYTVDSGFCSRARIWPLRPR